MSAPAYLYVIFRSRFRFCQEKYDKAFNDDRTIFILLHGYSLNAGAQSIGARWIKVAVLAARKKIIKKKNRIKKICALGDAAPPLLFRASNVIYETIMKVADY